ncbi:MULTISPECIES: ubiquinone biosynthesis hydroxylase [unclassified Bosea (in: a-proteobacteria)]|uniref:ubiquinone biosynthesis hydroxylase n=1 Tax=unclassified Bosea (in: a-proteobacteria) TaxID=2653178 RepID=UPI000F753B38|nr:MULTISPECIES: ubiquinone biosynthesis hydroxylase [unclassified Bosea (in: a-proteobacteria)]AZO81617.1 2-octaprenyl-6-methoxyphenyl hydroxylase [Bosea sp. Tri-49]RXT26958.1 2-octaprenyl-6-methoxyphenyl hydroxylase [Bosea sp. Tri-39]RXT40115.1 2-octaprenyl-6-methoxyphenyl hydroxylase [Bosea sp. Tri-54]
MAQSSESSSRRIVIAGGGVAGLTLAVALKQALGESFRVIVADPALAGPARADSRAYAVAAAARNMLEALGVWRLVEAASTPMTEMVITDSRTPDLVRPVFLSFDGEVEPGQPFAHMVENGALMAALLQVSRANGVELRAEGVRSSAVDDGGMTTVNFADGESLDCALLVAADGARSKLREQAGIGWVGWSYPQSGIVATIGHERPHEGRAVEHFLPSGPFAILPLPDGGKLGHRSSIVWTEATKNVPALLALDESDLLLEVERRFGLELGEITLESRPGAYPLSFGVARRFVGDRLALLGDAAHVIHPIAGQGLNLGLKDVAALAEVIVDAARLGLDVGSSDVLEDYEKGRRFDTVAMGVVTDGLNRLFSNDSTPLRLARDLGLGLVERMPGLKRFFIREAAGLGGSMPRLLKGEML